MDENQRRRAFQRVKSMSNANFWNWMNGVHSQAYFLGQRHMKEAMECIPGISKKQAEAVMSKAKEIREEWDGIKDVTIDQTEADELFGQQVKGGR